MKGSRASISIQKLSQAAFQPYGPTDLAKLL